MPPPGCTGWSSGTPCRARRPGGAFSTKALRERYSGVRGGETYKGNGRQVSIREFTKGGLVKGTWPAGRSKCAREVQAPVGVLVLL